VGDAPYFIDVWVNEERYERLRGSPVADLVREVFAGLQVIRVPVSEEEKDRILERFPAAKCDTATTRTIELLPRAAKDRLFALVAERRRVDVAGDFLRLLEEEPA
jgi:hypothetical protein